MEIKFNIGETFKKSMNLCTKFGEFWKGFEFPGNLGPAVSHSIMLGILVAAGLMFSNLMFFLGSLGGYTGLGFGYFFSQIIFMPIIYIAFFAIMPIVVALILAALAPNLGVDKGDSNAYATILAYSATPLAIAAFCSGVLMGLFGFILIAAGGTGALWLFAVIAYLIYFAGIILSLILFYNGLVQGVGVESGHAIILIFIAAIAYIIIWAILFGILGWAFGFGMLGPWSAGLAGMYR